MGIMVKHVSHHCNKLIESRLCENCVIGEEKIFMISANDKIFRNLVSVGN